MGLLLMLASLSLGIREEYRARNGIVTKEQQRKLDVFTELARQNAEREKQRQKERDELAKRLAKEAEEIRQLKWED